MAESGPSGRVPRRRLLDRLAAGLARLPTTRVMTVGGMVMVAVLRVSGADVRGSGPALVTPALSLLTEMGIGGCLYGIIGLRSDLRRQLHQSVSGRPRRAVSPAAVRGALGGLCLLGFAAAMATLGALLGSVPAAAISGVLAVTGLMAPEVGSAVGVLARRKPPDGPAPEGAVVGPTPTPPPADQPGETGGLYTRRDRRVSRDLLTKVFPGRNDIDPQSMERGPSVLSPPPVPTRAALNTPARSSAGTGTLGSRPAPARSSPSVPGP